MKHIHSLLRIHLKIHAFNNYHQLHSLNSCDSGWRPVAGYCGHSNKPSGSIKGRESCKIQFVI